MMKSWNMMNKRMKSLMRNYRMKMKKSLKMILMLKSFDHYNYLMNKS